MISHLRRAEKGEGGERRDRSGNRKAKEEMKKQLNLSYFQVCHVTSFR